MRAFKLKSLSTLSFYILTVLAISACSVANYSQKQTDNRQMILRDEGLSQLSYVNPRNPSQNWYVPVPAGRDLQLVGNGRVMIGTGDGYEERSLKTGEKLSAITAFKGTQTVRRLASGNTILAGANWQDKKGIVLVEVSGEGQVRRQIVYPGFSYVRCVRPTVKGTFLVTSNKIVFEGDDNGNVIWQAQVSSQRADPHIWQAVRVKEETVVATGYGNNFQVFGAKGQPLRSFTGPAEVNPHFFAGFQVLSNGNYVVSNWQGHGAKMGTKGHQVLEFTKEGKLVWSWKQDPEKYSSIQGLIVLDNLDTSKLHVEDENGVLKPVN